MPKAKKASETHPDTVHGGNTKHRAWCLTINNWKGDTPDTDESMCKVDKYICQKEVGKEGTEHLQAVVYFNNARSFGNVKSIFPTAHIEVCKDLDAAKRYCCKEDSRVSGPWAKEWSIPKPKKPLKILVEQQLYEWQKDIEDEIKEDAEDRRINWIYETEGNAGKTALCKYLASKYNVAYISGGKAGDIKYQVASMANLEDLVVLFDFARVLEGKVSYTAIEELKNGIFNSPKYESRSVIMNSPHVYIFANWLPEVENLSKDRWLIRRVGAKRNLIKHVL